MQIRKSVGRGGINSSDDVQIVQILLRKRGFDVGHVDGLVGPRTLQAILKFQVLFMKNPDGLVDVGGRTWHSLNSQHQQAKRISPPVASGHWSGDSSQWSQEKKLASLNPDFCAKVVEVLAKLREREFKPKVFYGWRSEAKQLELLKLGRTTVRFSFHNAQHVDGTPNAYAADVIDQRWGWESGASKNGFWDALGEEARAQALVWGGDWKSFRDEAHIQGRQNSELGATKRESGL